MDLVADRTRTTNRLKGPLNSMFPALERALDIGTAGALLLLTGHQTPAAIRRTGLARLTTWLRNRKVRGAEALAAKAVEAAERQHTAVAGGTAIATMVHTLAKEVMALNEKIAETDKLIEGRFREHELAEVIQSMPGIGTVLGAELLVGIGGRLDVFPTPDRLAAFAGVTPAPRDFGKIVGNLHRPQRYHRGLQRVFCTSALVSIQFDPNSRKFYDRKRAEGKRHVQAVLALACRRVNVLWALIRDRRCYQVTPPVTATVDFSIGKPSSRAECGRRSDGRGPRLSRNGPERRTPMSCGTDTLSVCQPSLGGEGGVKGGGRRGLAGAPDPRHPSAELLGQSDDDALGSADVAEPVAVLVLCQLADEFGAVSAQAGKGVLDVVDGEHDAVCAQNVVRPVARSGADRRGAAVLRQLEPAVTVRGPEHGDVTADAVESGALVGDEALDLRPAFQLHPEFHEERDSGIHALDDDADVVHPLNRHARFSLFRVRPVAAADALGRSRWHVLDILRHESQRAAFTTQPSTVPHADMARAASCEVCLGWATVVTDKGRHELRRACQSGGHPAESATHPPGRRPREQ